MENSIIQVVTTEMEKSAEDSLLSKISPMLLGGIGTGLLGGAAGGLMTKKRVGADGEEEDSSDYRKRVMRNALMVGGLGAVAGTGGGAVWDSLGKLKDGIPNADGEVPDQGSSLGNMLERLTSSKGAFLTGGVAGNVIARNVLKPAENAAKYLADQAANGTGIYKGIQSKFGGTFPGLNALGDTVTDAKQFSNNLSKHWAKDTNGIRGIIDEALPKGDKGMFYTNSGLKNPNANLGRTLSNAFSKITGTGSVKPMQAPTNKLNKFMSGLSKSRAANGLLGKGKGRGKIAALTALLGILPALGGTYIDDHNK